MPRILPRLVKEIAGSPPRPFESFELPRTRKVSLRKPVPSTPSFDPTEYQQSILLSPNNPVTSSSQYVQHKSLPPRIRVAKRVKAREQGDDAPREMTEEERRWWSSPYLRMIASPLRRCIVTGQYLPSDFLVRLGILRLPSTQPLRFVRHGLHVPSVLVPDGLQHSKFTTRRSGTAVYMLCRKEVIEHMNERGAYRRFSTDPHNLLGEQIQHMLRLRVLQELQLLLEQVAFRRKELAHQTLIRRLTREEWEQFRSTGVLSIENAVAVLVVPPVSRDPVTKQRPTPSMSASPSSYTLQTRGKTNDTTTTRPVSELFPVSSRPPSSNFSSPNGLATHKIPVYHGVSMFPDRTQRATLHKLLLQVLNVERRARFGRTRESNLKEKCSHAFVLLSDENTVQHGDVAALAIALWRIRMFEGSGWDEQSGWLQRSKYRSVPKFE